MLIISTPFSFARSVICDNGRILKPIIIALDAIARLTAVEQEMSSFEAEVRQAFADYQAQMDADFARQKAELEAALAQTEAQVDAEIQRMINEVNAAISLESNLPNLDCNVLNIELYVFSGAISIDL